MNTVERFKSYRARRHERAAERYMAQRNLDNANRHNRHDVFMHSSTRLM